MNPNEKSVFEKAIQEDRYDEATRRVFGDWLEEHGFDDEAKVQREWTREKQEAEDWLRDFANKCGGTCENYNEHWISIDKRYKQWERTTGRPIREIPPEYLDEGIVEETWVPITYEDAITAGHEALKENSYGYGFTQMGSEEARDLMGIEETRKKFWECWELVTGVKVSDKDKEHIVFSCSC